MLCRVTHSADRAFEFAMLSSVESCVSGCVSKAQDILSMSADCFNALSDVYGCLGGLTCPQVDAFSTETPPESYPCKTQQDAVNAACPFL
jgi:hypothetical protein